MYRIYAVAAIILLVAVAGCIHGVQKPSMQQKPAEGVKQIDIGSDLGELDEIGNLTAEDIPDFDFDI